mmetsp:Transcript_80991/g.131238  ORF Transcript_80991/g.131238 Transcript_80991/m.131238 type:complete len:87 (-) Transcript_80991:101-361(-)
MWLVRESELKARENIMASVYSRGPHMSGPHMWLVRKGELTASEPAFKPPVSQREFLHYQSNSAGSFPRKLTADLRCDDDLAMTFKC